MRYWSGNLIRNLKKHEIFVFGSNPQGRHGKGAAKSAMKFGAKYGQGRGLAGRTYALITKNLLSGYIEVLDDRTIVYQEAGNKSVSLAGIRDNIAELYDVAREHPDKDFLICYKATSRNLSGYKPKQVIGLFFSMDVPENIVFHDSFKPDTKEFRVVIAGGRRYNNFKYLTSYMDGVLFNKIKTHRIVIVCGMARGADLLGKRYAELRGFDVEEYPANWDKYGKSAGYRRNEEMSKICDAVVCFWDGKSKGTKSMIELTKEKELPLRVVRYAD